MQIVLTNNETRNVIAHGLEALHGFTNEITDLDVTKQRNGEVITTITLGAPAASQDHGSEETEELVETAEEVAGVDLEDDSDTPSLFKV